VLTKLGKAISLAFRNEKGEVNIQSILMMSIGMVFLAVGFIFFPILTGATDTILAYVYTGNATLNAAYYTGLTSITGITPLLVLIGFIAASVFTEFLGIKIMQGKATGAVNKGGILLSGLSIVFIAIGLIIFPIVLDGASTVLDGGGSGLNAAYTGFASFLRMSPMLVELGFLAAAVITGFFGIREFGKG
jgi:hypothetical protein